MNLIGRPEPDAVAATRLVIRSQTPSHRFQRKHRSLRRL